MGIFYITCFFISIFILLNLVLFIHNKFREEFICKGVPDNFLHTIDNKRVLDPLNDNKNIGYLKDATFGPDLSGKDEKCNDCVINNGRKIGEIIGEVEEGAKWSCDSYKENAENEWNEEYSDDFKRAIKIGCHYSLCDKIKNDEYLTAGWGLNKKQQGDIENLNNVITQNHGEYENYHNGSKSKIWGINSGNFLVHGDDENTDWQPIAQEEKTYFSQTRGIGNTTVNFKGIVDGKDKLLAWTNDSGNSKLFTCKKPCNGSDNIWDYDSKTVKPPNNNPSFYNILDMTSDNRYNWMIDYNAGKNILRKKLNNNENYINVDDEDYNNLFDGNNTQRKQIKNVFWKSINAMYNPVQITNNKLYVIILSHSNDGGGIYICKKPCTGEIYNWYKILDDVNKEISFIEGDIKENWVWYIKKKNTGAGDLWKIKITTNPPTQNPTPDVYEKKNENFKASITEKMIIKQNTLIKKVYGRDEKYLWVIFEGDSNIYGVDRNNNKIKKTINSNFDSQSNFIVEKHPNNRELQQKCVDFFDNNKCRDKTKNESSIVNEDAYCQYPDCDIRADLKTCCTLNQTCQKAKQDNPNFCNISNTNDNLGFKGDSLNELYCSGNECKQYKDDGTTPHEDIFTCCNPSNKKCNTTTTQEIGVYTANQIRDRAEKNNLFPNWEINKYKNKFDYLFNMWKTQDTGGKYQKINKVENFQPNSRGQQLFDKTKEPTIGEWNTIPTTIQTKLTPLDNLGVDVNKKTSFLKNLLQQGEDTDYDSLDPEFKMKKTCTGWNTYIGGGICPENKEIKSSTAEFFDGEDGKQISKTGDQVLATKSFCCVSCGVGQWDDNDTCKDCTVVENATSGATYTCSNAGDSRVSDCSGGFWKNGTGTADKCDKCGKVTNAASDATYTCSNAGDSRVSDCKDGYWKNGTGDADKCNPCTVVENALTVKCTDGTSSKAVTCELDFTLKDGSCKKKVVEGTGKNSKVKESGDAGAFRNIKEGFSGFSRNDWTNAQNYMNATNDNEQANWDQDENNNFVKGLKTWSSGTFNIDNIPCTDNFLKDTSWQYKDNGKKYCPPFKPICNPDKICIGDESQPELENKDDVDELNKVNDDLLLNSGYCTGIFSYCDGEGGEENSKCKLNQMGETWGNPPNNKSYSSINDYARLNNNPDSSSHETRKNSEKVKCSNNEFCANKYDSNWICSNEYCVKKNEGSQETRGISQGGNLSDGISKLTPEQERARDFYLSGEKKIKENNDKFLEGGVKINQLKGGIKGKLLNLQDTKQVMDVLKTKYIWYFKIPKDILLSLSRVPYLERINIGLKNFLIETINSSDFKNTKGDIKISYNKKAIEKSLLKLSKRTETISKGGKKIIKRYDYIGEVKKINNKVTYPWIEERTFKSNDNCTTGKNPHCTGDLTLTDLDTTQKPWGYKSRKAFKKKAPGTSDSFNKLEDTSDVGKYLYGDKGIRNPYDSVNPHPHQNDFIFLKN